MALFDAIILLFLVVSLLLIIRLLCTIASICDSVNRVEAKVEDFIDGVQEQADNKSTDKFNDLQGKLNEVLYKNLEILNIDITERLKNYREWSQK